jgi:hypothetical protein
MQADIDMDRLVPIASISGGKAIYGGIDIEYLKSILFNSANTNGTDISNANWLCGYCRTLFESMGTDKELIGNLGITSEQSHTMMRLLITLCRKLDIDFKPPFRDFDSFYSYWCNHDAVGDWSARRVIVGDAFDPLSQDLDDLQIDLDLKNDVLVLPVSPSRKVGWPDVDSEIDHMRQDFKQAKSDLDYSNIGNDAEGIVEKLSAVVFDIADKDGLIKDEERNSLTEDRTKNRLQIFVERKTNGDSTKLQALCKSVVELAQSTKHNRQTPTRKSAGIAADTAIMLANILRRLDS